MSTTTPSQTPVPAGSSEIVLPSHPGYDQARAIRNAMIERRPLRLQWCLWTSQEFFDPKKTVQNLNVPSLSLAQKHTN